MQLLEGAGPVVLRWCLVARMVSVVVTEYFSRVQTSVDLHGRQRLKNPSEFLIRRA